MCVRACERVFVYVCVRVRANVCVVCVRMRVCESVRARVCVCKGADARLYLLQPLVLVATSDGDGHVMAT